MLEVRTYTKKEISEALHYDTVPSRQTITRKLDRNGVKYSAEGQGENLSITITEIESPFKLFCMLDLDFDPHTDFIKVLEFFYYYFNDEEFRAMPDEVKQSRLDKMGIGISRQTIARYERRLSAANLVSTFYGDYIYYFANGDCQTMTDADTYRQAWREYWKNKDIYKGDTYLCIDIMKYKYGGVARKQVIPEFNVIEADTINTLNELITAEISKIF